MHRCLLTASALLILACTRGVEDRSAIPMGAPRAVRDARVEPTQLRLGRDSFAIRFTGLPEGSEIHEYATTPTGFVYHTQFQIGPAFSRVAVVHLDSALRVVASESATRLGATEGESRMTYSGGRAMGIIRSVERPGAGSITIDTILPSGAFDGLALYPLLLARHWQVGRVDTLTLFDTEEGAFSRQTARAVSADTLTIDGVAMPGIRIELSTTQLPVTIWISQARPHRLLRVSSDNGATTLVP